MPPSSKLLNQEPTLLTTIRWLGLFNDRVGGGQERDQMASCKESGADWTRGKRGRRAVFLLAVEGIIGSQGFRTEVFDGGMTSSFRHAKMEYVEPQLNPRGDGVQDSGKQIKWK